MDRFLSLLMQVIIDPHMRIEDVFFQETGSVAQINGLDNHFTFNF
jgi:hypothetical protein